MQPCVLIKVLTAKPQIVDNCRSRINCHLPKRRVLRRPHHGPIAPQLSSVGLQVVILVEVVLTCFLDKERIGCPGGAGFVTI